MIRKGLFRLWVCCSLAWVGLVVALVMFGLIEGKDPDGKWFMYVVMVSIVPPALLGIGFFDVAWVVAGFRSRK